MKKIRITSRMTSTDGGAFGAALFVAAPLAGAFGWSWYLSALARRARGFDSYSHAVEAAAVLCFVAGLAWLIGCLLVFYGRTYTHEIETVDAAAEAPPEPAGSPAADAESPFLTGRVRPGRGAF